MNCIFCKGNSDASVSVEHIIPESLGNKSHILERGIVCDKCNNYFAHKIEKEVLDLPYFKSLRHRTYIPSKKGKIPRHSAFVDHPRNGKVEIIQNIGNLIEVSVENEEIFNLVSTQKIKELYIPMFPLPPNDSIFLSRFLGKLALEALADRVKIVDGWNKDFIEHEGLDDLRNYVRFGEGNFWLYNVRRVYGENETFKEKKNNENLEKYQMLHEYDFLYIDSKYLFFICTIMGVEYAINMAESQLTQYIAWLKSNNKQSPLHDEYQLKKATNA